MKEPNSNIFYFWVGLAGFILILCLGGLLVYGLAQVIMQFLTFLWGVDSQVATQIIAASATVLAAVLTVVVGQLIAKSREIREAHRQRKTDVYNGFLEMVKDIMKAGASATVDEYVDRMRSFNSDLILCGSPAVIQACHEWYATAQTLGKRDPSAILAVDALYRAFRKDLGLSNKSLAKGDLIRLYLKPGEIEKMKGVKQ
ncbi:MAG: hypothetical protein HQ559_03755, partial [Lentisphaerae bacterium]|nr:hypothetical protein [Lentisphaerota bacterium]